MGSSSITGTAGFVSLVGAGPGDPKLMTLKGKERLCGCDAIVYDHLVHESLLSLARKDCVLIDAGKRAGGHSMPQEEINSLLIALARRHRHVVRLKGGDPFVFGRGAEECEALRKAGIPYEIIPGITSAIAAAESAGLPLTSRGMARSFHVITAQRRNGEEIPQEEYRVLAAAEGTLVFLMGVGCLNEIARGLIRGGMDPAVPAAVIERGTLPQERRLNGRLDDIADRARRAGAVSPAILVVGETAGMDCRSRVTAGSGVDQSWMSREYGFPAGDESACVSDVRSGSAGLSDEWKSSGRKRIFAVGSEQAVERLAREAAPYGIQTVCLLTLSAHPAADYDELVRAAGRMEDFRWVCFFSRQAVGIFRRAFAEAGADVRSLARCRFAVNGTAAAEALREWGIHPDYMAPRPEAESFASGFLAFLRESVTPDEAGGTAGGAASGEGARPQLAAAGEGGANPGPAILIPRAVRGSAEPGEQLAAAGYPVRSIWAYDMAAGEADRSAGPAFLAPDIGAASEAIVLLSGSGAAEWCRILEREGRTIPDAPTYYCMGPKTAGVLRNLYAQQEGICLKEAAGTLRIHVPEECSLQGLVHCIYDDFRNSCPDPA